MRALATLLLIFVAVCGWAQQLSQEDVDISLKDLELNVASELYHYSAKVAEDPSNFLSEAERLNVPVRDGKIYVQLREGWDSSVEIDEEELRELGLEVHATFRNTAGVWIAPDQLLDISANLPSKYLMRFDNNFATEHEGITVTNAADHQANGALGQGVTIAVIDIGYNQLTAAQNAGTAPSTVTLIDHTGSGQPFESGTVTHGTGCTEIIYEYAPNATYYLHKISGETQLALAVLSAIGNGVDFISASLSYFNTGWADNTGTPCAAVETATNAGLVYFHGVGNFNKRHYQEPFSDNDSDDWHNFGTTDEINGVDLEDGDDINAYLQWAGTPSTTNDFDLYLYDVSDLTVLASATGTSDFEELSWTNNTGGAITVGLAIYRYNSTKINFELFSPTGDDYEYGETGGSSASPSNSTEDMCITVGAVNQLVYGNASPNAEGFSSRGPTNNGLIVPDLAAPDNVTLTSYPNGFSGSSAGGPNTCGLAAILWSEHDYLSAEGVIEVIKGFARLYNDWGDPGKDNTFGDGGIYLPDFTNNARFIVPEANNVGGVNTLPYIDMEQADDLAPNNTNIFFLGGSHDVPAGVISTPMTYRSLHENATVKD